MARLDDVRRMAHHAEEQGTAAIGLALVALVELLDERLEPPPPSPVYQWAWERFEKELAQQTGWGRNQLKQLMADCLAGAVRDANG